MPVLISESEDLQHSFSRDLHEAFWRLEALTLSPTLSQDNLRATFSRASLMHVDAPGRFIPMHDFQHIAQHWPLQVWTTWSVSRTLFGSRKETFLTLNYFESIWCWFVMYWLHRPERYSHTTLMKITGRWYWGWGTQANRSSGVVCNERCNKRAFMKNPGTWDLHIYLTFQGNSCFFLFWESPGKTVFDTCNESLEVRRLEARLLSGARSGRFYGVGKLSQTWVAPPCEFVLLDKGWWMMAGGIFEGQVVHKWFIYILQLDSLSSEWW